VSKARDRAFVVTGLAAVCSALQANTAETIDGIFGWFGLAFMLWTVCFVIWCIDQSESDTPPGVGRA
jgi:hypothetical protein